MRIYKTNKYYLLVMSIMIYSCLVLSWTGNIFIWRFENGWQNIK